MFVAHGRVTAVTALSKQIRSMKRNNDLPSTRTAMSRLDLKGAPSLVSGCLDLFNVIGFLAFVGVQP